jgi:NIMA (never in mitosis gene a)-related kinase
MKNEIKDYIIEKEIGQGTFGFVYKATKKNDKKVYAIKQIPIRNVPENYKEQFKKEAEILSQIESKYVVKYYQSFEEDNKLYIVMEYCPKGDLNDFIENEKKKKKKLNEDLILKLFIKMTLGLAELHKKKILHRDLKTLNIFLTNDLDIRVGDLGVAKILNNTYYARTYIGTPYYLSPEICQEKPYNEKSDVWALGCILYELCTYSHPFTADRQTVLINKIIKEDPKPIIGYSKELKELVQKMFNKNFRRRPNCYDILTNLYIKKKAEEFGLYNDLKNTIKNFPGIKKMPITRSTNAQLKKNNNSSNKSTKNITPFNKKEDEKKNNIGNNNNNNNNNNNQRISSNENRNKFNFIKKVSKPENSPKIRLQACTERRKRGNQTSNTKGNNNNSINVGENSLSNDMKNTLGQNINNNNINEIKINKNDDIKEDNSNNNNERYINMLNKENEKKHKIKKEGDSIIEKSVGLENLISDFGDDDDDISENESLKSDLNESKKIIEKLKKDLLKLLGEEKYKNIMDICSKGIKDEKKQEEVNEKIDKFIKDNRSDNISDEKLYDIYQLFILQCQCYIKEKQLNNLK